LPRDRRETKKRVLSAGSVRPVKLRVPSVGGRTSRSRSRDGRSLRMSQQTAETIKKDMLRRQLEQKTKEVQSLRNKLLSKRLEQASFAKPLALTQAVRTNTIARPLPRDVHVSLPTAGSFSSFNPPPPLKQAHGTSAASVTADLNAGQVDYSQLGNEDLTLEPVTDLRVPPTTRDGSSHAAIVEVEVPDEQPAQRRPKAPELCWDLRRRVDSRQASKVHVISPRVEKQRLDEKKKLLQELMQKRRSLSAGATTRSESQAAVIDLS